MENSISAIVLGAGLGKRMKTNKPKVMCEVLFKPMIGWVVDALEKAGVNDICVVSAADDTMVRDYLHERVYFAQQKERLGTGHAVMCAKEFLQKTESENILVVCGDAPFLDEATVRKALVVHTQQNAALTVVSAFLENPTGYGRCVEENGKLIKIVEERDASEPERAICFVNSGILLFQKAALLQVLEQFTCNNAQQEYYLTQAVELLNQAGQTVCACQSGNPDVVLGANDKPALYALNEKARAAVLRRHMEEGVEFVNLDGIVIGPDVQIAPDACILPGCILKGHTKIGAGALIGPNSELTDAIIEEGAVIRQSVVSESKVCQGARIGPFSQIRPNCIIGKNVKIGDFVEVKNSTLGEKTSVAHLTYIGDSDVGEHVNFGCGCVTVNYDGVQKYRTTIGSHSFIGCNTNLVAPVIVGEGAYTAAGTTITKDVPPGALAIGRVKQENKSEWARLKLTSKKK